jgi:hypothetical protein
MAVHISSYLRFGAHVQAATHGNAPITMHDHHAPLTTHRHQFSTAHRDTAPRNHHKEPNTDTKFTSVSAPKPLKAHELGRVVNSGDHGVAALVHEEKCLGLGQLKVSKFWVICFSAELVEYVVVAFVCGLVNQPRFFEQVPVTV